MNIQRQTNTFNKGMDKLNSCMDNISKALNSKYYTGTASAVAALGSAGNIFEQGAIDCKDHPEFANLKSNFLKIESIIGNTFSGTVSIYGDSRDKTTLGKILDTLEEIAPYLSEIAAEIDSWDAFR